MKLSRRTIALALCTVLAMTTTVFGTIAYLTSTDTVTNTFTVGKVKIDLDETVVDENGNPLDENGNPIYDEDGNPLVDEDGDGVSDVPPARTEDSEEGGEGEEPAEEGNEYHMVPGQTYVKDPTVTVKAGSEESYVRVKVTVNRNSVLKTLLGDDYDFFTAFAAELGEGWELTGEPVEDADADTVTYELRYAETVAAGAEDVVLPAVFSEFTVPGALTGEDLEQLVAEGETDPFAVIVNGHAIQVATFEDADAAWLAFDEQTGE